MLIIFSNTFNAALPHKSPSQRVGGLPPVSDYLSGVFFEVKVF